ncbi:sensor histidine kinase [Nonomuraea rhizosphaerae]|uniref:sensor histidine kinase n=1 Tax=Nonomuraea rhizosphaerae TaxID=2665663 RepID=UPI001C5FD08C|nr:histidine kinase [Nonomuraea rhizosphaerae]
MATRPETAKKILLYWMDGTFALMAVALSLTVYATAAESLISVPHALVVEVCAMASLAFVPLVLRDAYDDRPRPTVKLALSGVLAAVTVALIPPRPPGGVEGSWDVIATLWLSAMALYLPLWATVWLGAAVVAVVTTYVSVIGEQPWQAVLTVQVVSTVLLPALTRIWRWLWWTIREAHDSREAKATLAVSEERLRFARDLHDLLGHSLSVLSLKSELAAKLATIDAGKAAAEMADVRRLAAESLAEVQVAVEGYQSLDLDEELAGAREALEAAGARCVVEARADDLSPAGRALLAWAVREGATNVLKHSTATRCAIVIDGGVLEMRNNGVPREGSPAHATDGHTADGRATDGRAAGGPAVPPNAGSGLRGLAERMSSAGGSFTAAPTASGEFVLRAVVRP